MPVVINEFEVLPQVQRVAEDSGSDAGGAPSAPAAIEPCAVAAALESLDAQALRVWAH